MTDAGSSVSQYTLRGSANERRRKRPDTLEDETGVCQAWQAGKCTKGKECRYRHAKYRHTDDQPQEGSGDVDGEAKEDETGPSVTAHEEPGAVEQFIVLESNLVAYGAGLEIRQIVPGYDLCQIILQLPIDTRKEDIEHLFLKQGLARFDFHVLKIEPDEKAVRATVVTKVQHAGRKVVDGLRKRSINFFEIRNNVIWTLGTTGKPALTLTWDTTDIERRMTRSSSSSSPIFSTVYQMLCETQGAQMKTCYLFNPSMGSTDQEALTLEFDTWQNAQTAARRIKAKKLRSLGCNVHWPYQYSIRIPFAQYEVQKTQWLDLTKRKRNQESCIKIDTVGEESVTIHVEGRNRKRIGALNTRIEKLARGEILEGTHWHPSFASKSSAEFFQQVTDTTAVHILCEPDIQALRLYGEPEHVDQVRSMIQREAQRREQVITQTRLTGASVAFFKREGFGKLQELVGEDRVNLKVTPKTTTIMVPGGAEATHHFRRLLEESSVGISVGAGQGAGTPTACPVCLNGALYPERLPCGHAYCPGCLNQLLTAVVDSNTFPIVCIGNEGMCNVPLALPFIRLFLPQFTFKRLLEAAFLSYLEQNPMQFQCCGTSGCEKTYRRQTKAVILSCPSCFARTCSSCGVEHENISCQEYERRTDLQLQEHLLVELARSKGYRRCPACRVLVEKDGGCDSMYCRCKRSLSWTNFKIV